MARKITDEQRLELARAIFDRVEDNSGDFGVANEEEIAEYLGKADALLAALPQLYFISAQASEDLSEATWEYSTTLYDHADQLSDVGQDEEAEELMAEAERYRELATSF